jgi:NAD(P)-dependent dehydrogenase (short-subunit alcohol dehydrogenase family)
MGILSGRSDNPYGQQSIDRPIASYSKKGDHNGGKTMKAIDANLTGKTALVTGATSGIGKEIARGLLKLGAEVVIGARDAAKGAAVRDELARETGKSSISVMTIDVASFASIRAFASAWGERPLHLLVNNAGVWYTDRKDSSDGYELTFATNVLGPHLLTQLLAPRLTASAPARIVNVVSAFASNYDANDLLFRTRKYDGFKAYGQSKQALRMLTWGMAARFEGTGVVANAAAPGFVKTNFNQNTHGFMSAMISFSSKLFAVSPEKGADTPLWVAADGSLSTANGKYFDARKEKDGKFRETPAIADLERRCDEMVSAGARTKAA